MEYIAVIPTHPPDKNGTNPIILNSNNTTTTFITHLEDILYFL
jgi:hypothetical protein